MPRAALCGVCPRVTIVEGRAPLSQSFSVHWALQCLPGRWQTTPAPHCRHPALAVSWSCLSQSPLSFLSCCILPCLLCTLLSLRSGGFASLRCGAENKYVPEAPAWATTHHALSLEPSSSNWSLSSVSLLAPSHLAGDVHSSWPPRTLCTPGTALLRLGYRRIFVSVLMPGSEKLEKLCLSHLRVRSSDKLSS